MSSLFALLSQQTPSLQTRIGLIVIGLQNDFTEAHGRLPVNDTDYLDRIIRLVPAFREFGHVIWVRSEFQVTRPVNGDDTPGDSVVVGSDDVDDLPSDSEQERSPHPTKAVQRSAKPSESLPEPIDGEDDEELFLTRTSSREPCCVRGSRGAEYHDQIKPLIQRGTDIQVVKSHYSAFAETSLLLTLRSKLITDVYVCGNMTNLSVYATAMDAARYGISITLVNDCLGYRRQERHDLAIQRLCDIMSAEVMTAEEVLDTLRNPFPEEEYSDESNDESASESEEEKVEEEEEADRVVGLPEPLEVDDGESDGEVELPIVCRPRFSEQRLALRSHRIPGKHSLSLDYERVPQQTRCTDSESDQRCGRHCQAVPRTSQPKLETSPSHHLRLGIRDSPKPSLPYKHSWLGLTRAEKPSESHCKSTMTTPRPKHPGIAGLSAVAGPPPSVAAEYEETLRRQAQEQQGHLSADLRREPLFGEDKELESAGSQILYDLLPTDLAETIFDNLQDQINWQSMYHRTGEVPRLVCCQGSVDEDGSTPLYRHPSDHTIPLQRWSAAVDKVRKAAEMAVGHSLNHALIQLYRGGFDYISEHSDKTLDVAPHSTIVNVSFGAQRTMRLRTKRPRPPSACDTDDADAQSAENSPPGRTTHRIPLPHNSLLAMSLATNARFLHGITSDRRPVTQLGAAERAFGGQRISLTFRRIATFLSRDAATIWGLGAVGKTREAARPVVSGDKEESERLVMAFASENRASDIDWGAIYGRGFDVLHLNLNLN